MPKRKASKRIRSEKSYGRRKPNKEIKKSILIVCEGETEVIYFEGLQTYLDLPLVEIEIVKEGSSPISVVNTAKTYHTQRKTIVQKNAKKGDGLFDKPEFDEVWCIFDTEGVQTDKTSFYRAINKARDNQFQLAVSNPSIEYWFLLHFEYTTQPFTSSSQVEKVLKEKDYLPTYTKKQSNLIVICKKLYPKTKTAINNAKQILKNKIDAKTQFPNPSTTIFKLVKGLFLYKHAT